MNWDRIEGKWKQLKGSVKQQWGKLTARVQVVSAATEAEKMRQPDGDSSVQRQ